MKNALLLLVCLAGGIFALMKQGQMEASCASCGPLALPDLPVPLQASSIVPVNLPYPVPPPPEVWHALPPAERLQNVRARISGPLKTVLSERQFAWGQPVFIRIIKEERALELWLQARGQWRLFRTYPVAAVSGGLGPKTQEGDKQAPEGFYKVNKAALNPASTFHLSFDIGYPNAYDRHHGRTGSFIMVHGAEVSIGCFAMTDPVIEEIYLLVEAALAGGQESVPVHVFPFRMTAERMAAEKSHPHAAFWAGLQPGFAAFETTGRPPDMEVKNGHYHLAR